jgi:hypothetical protein
MRKRIFFICGSMNQTTQMHQISKHLSDYEHSRPTTATALTRFFEDSG